MQPAQFTKISMRPKQSKHFSIIIFTSSREVTSHLIAIKRSSGKFSLEFKSAIIFLSFSYCLATKTTLTFPSIANALTTAKPMPPVAPVTIQTLPFKRFSKIIFKFFNNYLLFNGFGNEIISLFSNSCIQVRINCSSIFG